MKREKKKNDKKTTEKKSQTEMPVYAFEKFKYKSMCSSRLAFEKWKSTRHFTQTHQMHTTKNHWKIICNAHKYCTVQRRFNGQTSLAHMCCTFFFHFSLRIFWFVVSLTKIERKKFLAVDLKEPRSTNLHNNSIEMFIFHLGKGKKMKQICKHMSSSQFSNAISFTI